MMSGRCESRQEGGGGKCKARGTGSDFRHAPDLTADYVKVSEKEREIKRGKESDSDSGRDSNPLPGKWPAML